jgi:hypothetical protein
MWIRKDANAYKTYCRSARKPACGFIFTSSSIYHCESTITGRGNLTIPNPHFSRNFLSEILDKKLSLPDNISAIWIVFYGPERKNMTKLTCLDIAFKNNDHLKTNTALQMQAAKIEFNEGKFLWIIEKAHSGLNLRVPQNISKANQKRSYH